MGAYAGLRDQVRDCTRIHRTQSEQFHLQQVHQREEELDGYHKTINTELQGVVRFLDPEMLEWCLSGEPHIMYLGHNNGAFVNSPGERWRLKQPLTPVVTNISRAIYEGGIRLDFTLTYNLLRALEKYYRVCPVGERFKSGWTMQFTELGSELVNELVCYLCPAFCVWRDVLDEDGIQASLMRHPIPEHNYELVLSMIITK